jgi:hypothetical protein
MGLVWVRLKGVARHTCNRSTKQGGVMGEGSTWNSGRRFGLEPGCIYWLY